MNADASSPIACTRSHGWLSAMEKAGIVEADPWRELRAQRNRAAHEYKLDNHVDLVIRHPDSPEAPLFNIARMTGVRLDASSPVQW